MAHLTKLTQYSIEDSNIALLGSELEKKVREHAGDKEPAWENAGTSPGVQIWRIEQFHVVEWSTHRYGLFYDGDSYIVLHTYKKSPDASSFSYNLHFWLGQQTSQDEAGTAAYKTVELDDHLHGTPVQYREAQGHESSQFLSYFPHFISLHGGAATGFHHITEPLALNIHKLYRVKLSRHPSDRFNLVVREVPAQASSLIQGDVYILDQGTEILQLNTNGSEGKERFKAAEFVRNLSNDRKGECEVVVYDEGGPGFTRFLTELGAETLVSTASPEHLTEGGGATLYHLSDESGSTTFTPLAINQEFLSSNDAFLLDDSQDPLHPTIYIWLGRNSSLNERRLSVQYAQNYLHRKRQETGRELSTVPIIKQEEGFEVAMFMHKLKLNPFP